MKGRIVFEFDIMEGHEEEVREVLPSLAGTLQVSAGIRLARKMGVFDIRWSVEQGQVATTEEAERLTQLRRLDEHRAAVQSTGEIVGG